MDSPRWWNVAVSAITVLLAVLAFGSDLPPWRLIGALACLAAFTLGWFVVGRHGWGNSTAAIAYTVIIVLAVGGAVFFLPLMAILQCVAYPLVWMMAGSTRRAVLGNIALAAVVALGFWLSVASLVESLVTAVLSLAFSLALGLWITNISVQSEKRQELLTELRDAQAQLALANRESGVASERERLAREIHDTIAQDLTGLVMLAQRARRDAGGGEIGSTLALIEESAQTALAETRALVAASAPVGLGGGIQDALNRLAERFSRETGVTVGVEAEGIPPLDRDTEVVLLRVAQEGLANVRKHAAAGSAAIVLAATDAGVRLEVRDDGRGFDADAASSGFGLNGMRDRLALVDGNLAVESSIDGTVLAATLPTGVA